MQETHEDKIVYLRLDDIIPNRFQPREVFDETGLQELSESIKKHGVIQPIVVRKLGDKYELIAGERRTKASALAGLTTIPAIVRNIDDKESAKVSLLENLQRKNLSPIEEARTYKRIIQQDNLTQEELARTLGRSQPMVANKLRLLMLPDEIQDALMRNEISERHARSLLTLKDKKEQLGFLEKIKKERLTVRELDKKLKEYKENPNSMTFDLELDEDSNSKKVIEADDGLELIEKKDSEIKEENKENDERSFMNNNIGNFGGMGLNDYQSSVQGNMYNSYSNSFNNMPNSSNEGTIGYNYNRFDSMGNNNQNNFSNGLQAQNSGINMNQSSSLGSMFDGFSNQPANVPATPNNPGVFVSHIREDNLPKTDNQFLPNFDDFNQNNGMNNYNQFDGMNNNQNINNFSNQSQDSNFQNFNMQSNFGNNFNNSFGNNINDNNGMNNYNFDTNPNNMNNVTPNNFSNNQNYFMNDLNNNQNFGNSNQMMPGFDANQSESSYNSINTPENNFNMQAPNYNSDINSSQNLSYESNQGAMFAQPLNIIAVPENNEEINNNDFSQNMNNVENNNMTQNGMGENNLNSQTNMNYNMQSQQSSYDASTGNNNAMMQSNNQTTMESEMPMPIDINNINGMSNQDNAMNYNLNDGSQQVNVINNNEMPPYNSSAPNMQQNSLNNMDSNIPQNSQESVATSSMETNSNVATNVDYNNMQMDNSMTDMNPQDSYNLNEVNTGVENNSNTDINSNSNMNNVQPSTSIESQNEVPSEFVNKDDYIRLDPVYTINSPTEAVLELKKTTDKIKQNKIDIETEEIDFGDVYQITIKIRKADDII